MMSTIFFHIESRLRRTGIALIALLFMPLVHASAFQGPLNIEAFGDEMLIRYDIQNEEVTLFTEKSIQIYLEVAIEDARIGAERSRIAMMQAHEARDRLRAEIEELNELVQRVHTAVGAMGADASSINQTIAELQRERGQTMIELAGLEARKDAVTDQLERIVAEIEEASHDDPIMSQLIMLRELQERRFERLKALHAQGAVAEESMNQAMTAVAEAELRLLERQEELKSQANNPEMESLQKELTTTTLAIAEAEARIEAIRFQLNIMSEAQSELGQLPLQWEATSDALVARLMQLDGDVESHERAHQAAHAKMDYWSELKQEWLASLDDE